MIHMRFRGEEEVFSTSSHGFKVDKDGGILPRRDINHRPKLPSILHHLTRCRSKLRVSKVGIFRESAPERAPFNLFFARS